MIPNAEAMMICDQTRGKRISIALLEICTPSPVVGPPKYSATIALMILRLVLIFSPLKIKGNAAGKRNLRKISNSLAASDRINSSEAGSTEVSPRTVLIIVGKKVRIATMMILDVGLTIPNHAFVMGAKAIIGMELTAIAYGKTVLLNPAKRAEIRPNTTPAPQPMPKPHRTFWNVNHP